ncbi:MAG: hypothetical protein KA712_10925 [Myxococcales bacterium]|nr:hypothetical protein [Myxococcales bacterium]
MKTIRVVGALMALLSGPALLGTASAAACDGKEGKKSVVGSLACDGKEGKKSLSLACDGKEGKKSLSLACDGKEGKKSVLS